MRPRRIDNQLRGRSGRQGDPGSSRFFLSLEDDLMRKFAGDKVKAILGRLGLRGGEVIEHPWVTRSVGTAQKRVENHNFEIRKNLLKYDEVSNEQRKLIYGMRQEVLEAEGLREKMLNLLDEAIYAALERFIPEKTAIEECDLDGLALWFERKLGAKAVYASELQEVPMKQLDTYLRDIGKKHYEDREGEVGEEMMREVERFILLQTIDTKWKDHLYTMDYLRSGIGMEGWLAQRDPQVIYKKRAYEAFQDMLGHLAEDATNLIFRVMRVGSEEREHLEGTWSGGVAQHQSTSAYEAQQAQAVEGSKTPDKPKPIRRQEKKVGRNEACPCGSGQKFKRCCGRGA